MANYTYPITQNIGNILSVIPNLAINDTITTGGYYAPGDGGGATFTVRAKATGETPDSYFTFVVANDSTLIVALDIPNGVVNIDQLGAKGDAVLPSNYDDMVETIVLCNSRTCATLNANSGATDNASFFESAINYADVQEIRLTPGKIYGVKRPIEFNRKSNKKLNGCGATIMNVHEVIPNVYNSNIYMLKVTGAADTFVHDVEICDLRLIGNCRFNESLISDTEDMHENVKIYSQGIFVKNGYNIRIHDVQIERFGYGIHTTTDTNNVMNQVQISHVQIKNVIMGVQLNCVQNSHVVSSDISADYTMLASSTKYNHCIYVARRLENCTFAKLKLRNAYGGIAIKLCGSKASVTQDDETIEVIFKCKNVHIRDIYIDACSTAFGTELFVENLFVDRVFATNLRKSGIQLLGVRNAEYSKCTFLADLNKDGSDIEEEGGFLISNDGYGSSPNSLVKNVTICNCVFDFRKRLLRVGLERADNCEGIRVVNSSFKIHNPQLGAVYAPAHIKGVVKDIRFIGCRFETNGFTTVHDHGGVMFYFDGSMGQDEYELDGITLKHTAIPNKMHWVFDKCTFVNNGTSTISSLMLSDNQYDKNETVYCQIRNCVLEGFRWIMRISFGANQNVAYRDSATGIYWINPCYSGIDTEKCVEATRLMNQIGRYTSQGNLYRRYDAAYGNQPRFISAEEYDI